MLGHVCCRLEVSMPLFKHYPLNTSGRDFAVGDIHGCYTRLEQALRALHFDPRIDRLFSVGDLIDRGPESARFAEFLGKDWFHANRGNHEQMMLDAPMDRSWEDNWLNDNGGAWSKVHDRAQMDAWCAQLNALPVAVEVETMHGPVGLVHADPMLPTWAAVRAHLEALSDTDEPQFDRFVNGMLWSRALINKMLDDQDRPASGLGLPDLHAVVIGHTPLDMPLHIGNVWAIDTGACYRDALTLLNLHTFQVHSFACQPEK